MTVDKVQKADGIKAVVVSGRSDVLRKINVTALIIAEIRRDKDDVETGRDVTEDSDEMGDGG